MFREDLDKLQQENSRLKAQHDIQQRALREAEALLSELKAREPEVRAQYAEDVSNTERQVKENQAAIEQLLTQLGEINTETADLQARNEATAMWNETNRHLLELHETSKYEERKLGLHYAIRLATRQSEDLANQLRNV